MEDKKKICMLVSNDLKNDPRVRKEAEIAGRKGFDVTVIGITDNPDFSPLIIKEEYFTLIVKKRTNIYVLYLISSLLFYIITNRSLKVISGMIFNHAKMNRDKKIFGAIYSFKEFFKKLLETKKTEIIKKPIDKDNENERPIEETNSVSPSVLKHGPLATKVSKMLDELFLACLYRDINAVLLEECLKHDFDLYHANDLDTLAVAVKAAKKKNVVSVFDAHELWTEMNPEWSALFKGVAARIEKKYITQVDQVIAVNESIGKELSERYNIKQPLSVTNCPTYSTYDSLSKKDFLKKLDIDKDKVIALYQGRYEYGRGLEELVEAGRFINENVIIVFRGYGINEPELRSKSIDLGVQNRVFFVEPVPMKDLVIAATVADIGVMPYRPTCINNYYATPNKIFEYMMAGLSIAGSNIPEVRKIIKTANCGICFDPDKPEQIGNAINQMAANAEKLKNYKDNAKNAARDIYNWEKESEKLVDSYKQLTGVSTI